MLKRIIISFLLMMIPTLVIAEQSSIKYESPNPQAIIDVLSNGYKLCPSGISLDRLGEAHTVLNDALFEDGASEQFKGTIWLLTGTMCYDRYGGYIDVDGKKISVTRILNREDPSGNYEFPEYGASANFYLTYSGSFDGYAIFYLGDVSTN